MRIKTITAVDMTEALRIIRQQLGSQALILNTRKIKGEKGPTLEITAAVDEPAPETRPMAPLSTILEAADKADKTHTLPDSSPLTGSLREHGVPETLILRITKAVKGLQQSEFSTPDALEMLLGKLVKFHTPPEIITKGGAHALIGPTGAGKTTLVAKLAIHAKRQKMKVGLLSLDDQKIAGFEPLRVAADALGETAYLIKDAKDLAKAAKQLGPRHIILIDTPGLNPYNHAALAKFKKRLDALKIPVTTHLVMPAVYNLAELEKLPLAFIAFKPTSLMVSKLDEAAHLGGILSVANTHQLPVGIAAHSPDFTDAPFSLSPRWLAETLCTVPQQPWEMSDAD